MSILSKSQRQDIDTMTWLIANPGKKMVVVAPTQQAANDAANRAKALVHQTTGRNVERSPIIKDGKRIKGVQLRLPDEKSEVTK